jgi:hypothetical protein
MGIELATYCPELTYNENDEDNGTNIINPVDALRSPQRNTTALELSLDEPVAAQPRGVRHISSLPERIFDLPDYIGRLRPWERRFALGNWEGHLVYVSLDRGVEIELQRLFRGKVEIDGCIDFQTGDWEGFWTDGYCVGCIEGTGTALISVERSNGPKQWLLWTPERAVQEGWEGLDWDNGHRGWFIQVGEDFDMSANPFHGSVEALHN